MCQFVTRFWLSAAALLVAAAQAMAQAPVSGDIVVAVPAPLSGARAALGLSVHTAAGIVAAEINAAGGIDGRSLVIALRDDPCSAVASLALAREIAAGPAVAVIGHPCAPSARVAGPIYAAAGKTFIAAGPAAAVLFAVRPGPQVFRLPVPAAQGDVLATLVVREAGAPGARVAIIRDKTQLNIGLAAPIEAALKATGRFAVTEIFTGGDKDFSAMARRLAAAQVTHAVVLAFTIEGALIAGDLVRALPGIEILGPDQLGTPDFGALAGTTAAERVRILLPATVESYGARWPAARQFAERLHASGVVPSREALETAAALQVWAAAVRAPPEAAGAALMMPTETVLGPLAFDARGHAVLPFWTVHRWRDGAFKAEE